MKLTLDGYDWAGEKLYLKDEKGKEHVLEVPSNISVILGLASVLLTRGKQLTEKLMFSVKCIKNVS